MSERMQRYAVHGHVNDTRIELSTDDGDTVLVDRVGILVPHQRSPEAFDRDMWLAHAEASDVAREFSDMSTIVQGSTWADVLALAKSHAADVYMHHQGDKVLAIARKCAAAAATEQ